MPEWTRSGTASMRKWRREEMNEVQTDRWPTRGLGGLADRLAARMG